MSAAKLRPRPWRVPREKAGSGLRAATVPPEARGIARDGVRLLVSTGAEIARARFRDLPRFLRAGDVLVVNESATLPAAVDVVRAGGEPATVHFSTQLEPEVWSIELRPSGRAEGPVDDAREGERLVLPSGVEMTIEAPYPDPSLSRPRLWRARLAAGADAEQVMRRYGRPISYAYVEGRWPLAAYQTVFAREAGSAEMPSAARPFTRELVATLEANGVAFAPIVLHTGVSSLEPGEPPYPERYSVPAESVQLVESARRAGGRVIAAGTTAARAIETAASPDGTLHPGSGWTDLVLGPGRAARVLDCIITGWHPPEASHVRLLEAIVGAEQVARALAVGARCGYLAHEFGDSCLLVKRIAG